jgi:hypothetical protein
MAMSDMQLVPQGKSHVELWAIAIADRLIVAGQIIHRRFAVMPYAPEPDLLFMRLEGWRTSMQQFITFGDPLGFSQRKLAEAGVARRKAYDKYMRVLKEAGLLIVYERSGAYWAYGWDKRKALVMIRRRLVELPYPVLEDAPPLFVGRAADTQLAQHTQLTQVSTVFARSAPKGPRLKGK